MTHDTQGTDERQKGFRQVALGALLIYSGFIGAAAAHLMFRFSIDGPLPTGGWLGSMFLGAGLLVVPILLWSAARRPARGGLGALAVFVAGPVLASAVAGLATLFGTVWAEPFFERGGGLTWGSSGPVGVSGLLVTYGGCCGVPLGLVFTALVVPFLVSADHRTKRLSVG